MVRRKINSNIFHFLIKQSYSEYFMESGYLVEWIGLSNDSKHKAQPSKGILRVIYSV